MHENTLTVPNTALYPIIRIIKSNILAPRLLLNLLLRKMRPKSLKDKIAQLWIDNIYLGPRRSVKRTLTIKTTWNEGWLKLLNSALTYCVNFYNKDRNFSKCKTFWFLPWKTEENRGHANEFAKRDLTFTYVNSKVPLFSRMDWEVV